MIDPLTIDVDGFLIDWCGPPLAPPRDLPASCRWLPEPLRDLHRLVSRWPGPRPYFGLLNMRDPEEIEAKGRAVTFMSDPTGDWLWAFDLDDPDVVYDRELYEGWEEVDESLSVFLRHAVVQEAMCVGSARRWGEVPRDRLEDVLAPMTEVAFGAWRWPGPGRRIFMNDGLVAEVLSLEGPGISRPVPGLVEVSIAANTPKGLAYLDAVAEIPGLRRADPPRSLSQTP
ncbi:hypothetical protein ACIRL2_49935 [Embleya sp. NPDC127516]|uniref:hypothetical protein n=1 Tax=Embleya sp. NPDC127516 TaxID=3363990 RepID=UPI0037F17C5B